MASTDIDYYELLEVSHDADGATIKSAYRKLAMKYHPDRNSGCTDSEAKFKAINEAYDCLKDPQKRAAYDRFGHAAFQQGMGNGGGFGGRGHGSSDFGDIGDIFETIFGTAFGGGGGRGQPRRGADLRYDLEVTLDEAFHGKTIELEIEVSQNCESCSGLGATPGTGESECRMCDGHGKVRAKQGFFVIERPCPTCPELARQLIEKGVEIRGCEATVKLVAAAIPATDADWDTEYLAPILSIRVVEGLDEAMAHIRRHSSGHTEAIVTEDYTRARRFLREVDSSSVMVNASTRFADGFEYGLGAEIGISTDKLHARGPVGLEGLTTQKFVVLGDGQIRE